eukprot:352715-Chlamydomonas_euryale.AAC.1
MHPTHQMMTRSRPLSGVVPHKLCSSAIGTTASARLDSSRLMSTRHIGIASPGYVNCTNWGRWARVAARRQGTSTARMGAGGRGLRRAGRAHQLQEWGAGGRGVGRAGKARQLQDRGQVGEGWVAQAEYVDFKAGVPVMTLAGAVLAKCPEITFASAAGSPYWVYVWAASHNLSACSLASVVSHLSLPADPPLLQPYPTTHKDKDKADFIQEVGHHFAGRHKKE